ncbi:hypothetical protein HG536_0B00950 [Torulaspora globosa]|uniref:SUN-like protein 1 n=1 Tax=Torulaspora globosa TaxID=48254 RepID=A0A7G3ZCJ8_9SACH|nr:uncharacterized protein HG536_0B00950 [Torulaspora globosa]QLL31234.1 hypothetical protein HG536_0B00950 [Torulaspora globosa]
MVWGWLLLPLLFNFIGKASAAGQRVCPVPDERACFTDELTPFLQDDMFSTEMLLPRTESTEFIELSSSIPTPIKLNLPTTIHSVAVRMKNSSRPAAIDTNDRNETNGTFISFDQWREAKLKEENIEVRASSSWEAAEGDAIGDGMEVELGFLSSAEDNDSAQIGTQAGKHRFNFASLDCAATIVKTNIEASGASSILIDNKDKYLLNPCFVPNKFVVIELCQDILVEEVAIANFEFFSSTFKRVRFSVSDRFPVAKNGWIVLSEVEAENTRNLQTFPIPNPQIWARFLLIEILSHHDNEYYCPISLVQVHGKTMMDEFKMDNSRPSGQKPIKEEAIQIQGNPESEAAEECSLWPSIDFDHIMVPSKSSDALKNCTCRLAPLKFEEFLRDLNDTYCPAPIKDAIHAPASSTPSATTEESIFKNIVKRLTSLESNATLSILYMEEQGKLLSSSFNNLEKAQIAKFDGLVSMFNDTMMDNLRALRNFANQLKDQSIKILEEQKLNNDEFTTHTSQRLEVLEQKLKGQRNLAYAANCAVVFALFYLFLSREFKYDTKFDNAVERQISESFERPLPNETPNLESASSLPVSPVSLSGSSITSK